MTECECGNAKPTVAICCKGCAFLDGIPQMPCGGIKADHELISILRLETQGLTVHDLADRLNRQKQSVLRTLQRLTQYGRIIRREYEVAGMTYSAVYFLHVPFDFSTC